MKTVIVPRTISDNLCFHPVLLSGFFRFIHLTRFVPSLQKPVLTWRCKEIWALIWESVCEEEQSQGQGGDPNLGSYIAEDVTVQGCAMDVGAFSVPQTNGVVRGAGDERTRGETGLIVVLHLWIHLKASKINSWIILPDIWHPRHW